MNRFVGPSEHLAHSHKAREEIREAYRLNQKNMEKIKRSALKIIKYPEYKEAFDYVDEIFPNMGVKEVLVYKVSSKLMEQIGFAHCEGLYNKFFKVIVLSSKKKTRRMSGSNYPVAKVKRDEVLVHELCHYCYEAEGNYSISMEMIEEFAYGWSIGYLRKKGYTDDYIVKYNFLPYLVSVSQNAALLAILAELRIPNYKFQNYGKFERKSFFKKYSKRIMEKAIEIGTEKGQKIIAIYSKQLEKGSYYTGNKSEVSRFDLLDI